MDSLFKSMGLFDFTSKDLEIYEACLRAKQARTQFTNSENKAENLYELVHCDI